MYHDTRVDVFLNRRPGLCSLPKGTLRHRAPGSVSSNDLALPVLSFDDPVEEDAIPSALPPDSNSTGLVSADQIT